MTTLVIRALVSAAVLLAAVPLCGAAEPLGFGPSNPFYTLSKLPFHAPRFDKIHDEDFEPAMLAGMARQRAEMDAIAANPAAPTFENTLVPMERSGQLLNRVQAAFNIVTEANTDDKLQGVKAKLAPLLAAHQDAILLNSVLFTRVAAVYQKRESAGLDPESRRLVEYTYDQFVHSGANLSPADKSTLEKLNEEASTLSDSFVTKLLAATKDGAFHSETPAALTGLSDARIASAAATAQSRQMSGYVLALQNTTQQPDFAELQDRATRHTIFENSWGRAEHGDANDTRATIARLAQLRAQRAKLLGFPSHAAWKLGDQMAHTPEAAVQFMDALVPVATAKAAREAAEIQALMDAQHVGFQLAAWDWEFYGTQVRKSRYGIEADEVKPYFELGRVLVDGVFFAANQLYGITFTELKNIPVYQPDVRVFEVRDVDGKPLALFYCDYFKRDNKKGGAWMSNLVDQSQLLGMRPVIYNVANFSKPAPGAPALITFEDVTTMFHEFGHALHGMFANTRYPSLSGTATARDFVEFPSQFNEHWASYPLVFNHFARHYQTGQVMPAALVEKIKKAENADEGYRLTEVLGAAELDMQWHLLSADAPLQNPDEFEIRALDHAHLNLPTLPPRYRSSYFSHIWDNDYSAGYYAYLWTQMLDDDAYAWFEEHGGLTRANGDRFRQMVLSRGNTEELAALYKSWRGRSPTIDAMMKYRGLATP